MGKLNDVVNNWLEEIKDEPGPLDSLFAFIENGETEEKKANKVETILSDNTSKNINELTLKLAEAKESGAMDDAACDSMLQQNLDNLDKVIENKKASEKKQEVVIVKTVDDAINELANNKELIEKLNKVTKGKGQVNIDALKVLAHTAVEAGEEGIQELLGDLEGILGGLNIMKDPVMVPFDEDKKQKPEENKKASTGKDKVIDVDAKELKEVPKNKQPQDAIKLFNTKEEAIAAAKKEDEKEKLERVDSLPPVTVNRIKPVENAVTEIENSKVKDYLTELFTKVLKGNPFELYQHKNGLYIIRMNGIDTWFDNNMVIRKGVNFIVDTYKIGPDGMVRKFVEFLPVKNHSDIALAWATNANNIRQTGIQDPTLLQLLEVERAIPMEVIKGIDFSTVTREQANSEDFIKNIYQLFMCPQMRAVPPVRYKVKAYKSPNKFVLTSDETVKSQMMDFGLTGDRYANNLTIAFDNRNNIKVMYSGKKMQFSLDK